MAQQTLVNGNRYSFVNLEVTLAGASVNGIPTSTGAPLPKGVFKSVNYDAMQDPGLVQGNQTAPVGYTAGYANSTGAFEMLVSEWDDFILLLTNGGQYPIMTVDFNITVSYSVNDIDVRTDLLLGCRITKIGSANQQGTDATTKACDMKISQPFYNGIAAYSTNL